MLMFNKVNFKLFYIWKIIPSHVHFIQLCQDSELNIKFAIFVFYFVEAYLKES